MKEILTEDLLNSLRLMKYDRSRTIMENNLLVEQGLWDSKSGDNKYWVVLYNKLKSFGLNPKYGNNGKQVTDPNIATIIYWGQWIIWKDLNKNGGDEIGLLPGWFQSCWHNYNVWTLLNGKWVYAVKPFLTFCDQWDAGIKPIEIDYNKEGFVIIRYSEHSDVKITTKSKSVRIVK